MLRTRLPNIVVMLCPSGELPPDPAHPAPFSPAPIQHLSALHGQRGDAELMQSLQELTRRVSASRAAVCSGHGHILFGKGPDAPGEGQTDRGVDQDAEAEAEAGGDPPVPAGTWQDDQWSRAEEGRK